VIDSIWNLLFRCQHRKTTFPLTPVRKKNDNNPAETYIVCLECGRQFTYDWDNMRLGKVADISGGPAPSEPVPVRIPFRTKSNLRYLIWGSALSAALVVGKAIQTRKRPPVTRVKRFRSALEDGESDLTEDPQESRPS
jgi:hypothetical protein